MFVDFYIFHSKCLKVLGQNNFAHIILLHIVNTLTPHLEVMLCLDQRNFQSPYLEWRLPAEVYKEHVMSLHHMVKHLLAWKCSDCWPEEDRRQSHKQKHYSLDYKIMCLPLVNCLELRKRLQTKWNREELSWTSHIRTLIYLFLRTAYWTRPCFFSSWTLV